METRRLRTRREDRPAMVVGWIEDPAKILTEVFRQLSEQDALSRILAIYNRELHSAASMEADIERRTTMQTTPARSTRLSEALAYLGTSTSCTRSPARKRGGALNSGIGYPKGESRWQAVTMAVHAVKMAAVCAVVGRH